MALLGLLTGCYAYAPISSSPAPGTRVRAQLTAPGALRLTEAVGAPRRVAEGQVVRWGDGSVVLAVPRATRWSPAGHAVQWDTVPIPRTDIAALEARRLSYWKTGLAVGSLGTAIVLVYRTLFTGGGGEGGGAEPPPDGRAIQSPLPVIAIPR